MGILLIIASAQSLAIHLTEYQYASFSSCCCSCRPFCPHSRPRQFRVQSQSTASTCCHPKAQPEQNHWKQYTFRKSQYKDELSKCRISPSHQVGQSCRWRLLTTYSKLSFAYANSISADKTSEWYSRHSLHRCWKCLPRASRCRWSDLLRYHRYWKQRYLARQ